MSLVELERLPAPSLRYAGRSSEGFVEAWSEESSSEAVEGGSVDRVVRRDPDSGLCLTISRRRYEAHTAVDWVVELANEGQAPTPIIEDILPLDLRLPLASGELLRLHHARGSSCRMDDFLPEVSELPPNSRACLAPQGGRSSNGTLPFMNLQHRDGGLVLAIGWSGQWAAQFERGEDGLHLTAGMERTHLRLLPGERIRTPRILLLSWDGDDPEAGNNALRRLLIEHYLPRLAGELVMPPTAQCLQAYFYLTGEAAEANEMVALPRTAQIGAEAYWIDACWYGESGSWWEQVGSWVVNRERFPNGLKPISDAAHERGMKFVLWFEPERVRPGSLLHREHPEFLLTSEGDTNLLLDLGQPQARQYITDLVSDLITQNGVDIYRQDFNFDPLPYWEAADAADRVGMAQIRYVEGHYAFWDELRRRHPALWIDNCASGGRRIDLETMSRSLPLWPSDFPDIGGLPHGQGLHVGDQCINAGLARWVPLFGGGVWNFTPYGTRGQIIGGFSFGFHIDAGEYAPDGSSSAVVPNDVMARGKTLLDDDFPLDAARSAIAEWQSIRPFFLGDFHLLLPLTASPHDWCAWQFHRHDMAAGVAVFLRRHQSPFSTMQAALRWVDDDAQYDVSLSPGYTEAPRQRMSGGELSGLSLDIPERPGSLLLRYEQVR